MGLKQNTHRKTNVAPMTDTALQPAQRWQESLSKQLRWRCSEGSTCSCESKDLSHKSAACLPGYGQPPCQLHSEPWGRMGATMGWGVHAMGCPGDGLFVGWGCFGMESPYNGLSMEWSCQWDGVVHVIGCLWDGMPMGWAVHWAVSP